MIRHLTVEVICHWSVDPPAYRIFVDDDLMTERTFGWAGYQFYIRESLAVDVAAGMHNLRLENLGPNGKFTLRNMTVDGNLNQEIFLKYQDNLIDWNFACHQ